MGTDFKYCLGITLLITSCFFAMLDSKWLCVQNASGKSVLVAIFPEEREFGIRFKHSVALSPVEDWFKASGNNVALTHTVYQDFGAGLPHQAEYGQTMRFFDGKVVISGYTLVLPQLEVRVGRVAQHKLLLPRGTGKEYAEIQLDSLAKPGAALSFSVFSSSWLRTLWRHWNVLY